MHPFNFQIIRRKKQHLHTQIKPARYEPRVRAALPQFGGKLKAAQGIHRGARSLSGSCSAIGAQPTTIVPGDNTATPFSAPGTTKSPRRCAKPLNARALAPSSQTQLWLFPRFAKMELE